MKYIGLPQSIWILFKNSFKKQLNIVFKYDKKTSTKIKKEAKIKYKEIIKKLPKFEKEDHYIMNIVGASLLVAFILSMPNRPDVDKLTIYYEKSQMTKLMKWFCKIGGKSKFSKKDIKQMEASAKLKAAERNPYSWNMEFYEYSDKSGYEARFTKCGICRLMKDFGLYDLTSALCHLDYAMNAAISHYGGMILWYF